MYSPLIAIRTISVFNQWKNEKKLKLKELFKQKNPPIQEDL